MASVIAKEHVAIVDHHHGKRRLPRPPDSLLDVERIPHALVTQDFSALCKVSMFTHNEPYVIEATKTTYLATHRLGILEDYYGG